MSNLDEYAEAMKRLEAEYRKAREGIGKVQDGVSGTTANVRGKSRKVSATVDGSGKLLELRFHGQSYRSLAPTELAELVVETVNKAHEAAQRDMWKSIAGFLPPGLTAERVATGTIDWADALADSITLPALVQEYLDQPAPGRTGGGAAPSEG
jgi:DNA-binding protein YbaB